MRTGRAIRLLARVVAQAILPVGERRGSIPRCSPVFLGVQAEKQQLQVRRPWPLRGHSQARLPVLLGTSALRVPLTEEQGVGRIGEMKSMTFAGVSCALCCCQRCAEVFSGMGGVA